MMNQKFYITNYKVHSNLETQREESFVAPGEQHFQTHLKYSRQLWILERANTYLQQFENVFQTFDYEMCFWVLQRGFLFINRSVLLSWLPSVSYCNITDILQKVSEGEKFNISLSQTIWGHLSLWPNFVPIFKTDTFSFS